MCVCVCERESTEYLGFSLHTDFESREASREYASEALPLEGVEEVKPRRGQAEEPPPFLHHSYARMIYARAKHCAASPHGFSLVFSLLFSVYFVVCKTDTTCVPINGISRLDLHISSS